jgi:transmembrane 9 superfamily protein 3
VTVCLLGGALPFGAIFVELFFVFNSLFLYRFYYLYGFMLLVFVILVLVTVCVTIVSTYFLLNAEEYRWQWFSFLSAASTALYVYLYSVYFFLVKTQMAGFLQTSYYFGTVGVLVQVVALLCGSVGYFGASTFVHAIYRRIKSD